MSPVVQVVASVLLTAVIAFGHCSVCLASSLATSDDNHACCKPRQVQSSCHKSTPEPAQHQNDCSGQLELLKSAQASERMSVMPSLAFSAFVDPLAIGLAEHGMHSPGDTVTSDPSHPLFLVAPLRI